jgi:hypothetical protein
MINPHDFFWESLYSVTWIRKKKHTQEKIQKAVELFIILGVSIGSSF